MIIRMNAAFLLLGCALLCACKPSSIQVDIPIKSERQGTKPIDASTSGAIAGQVKFSGAAPTAQRIDMSQDPACGAKPSYDESYAVNNGAFGNVLVYVKQGLETYATAKPTTPAQITQQNCRYAPHVMGVVVGQQVLIVNGDQTTHNIHPMPTTSKQWNESQLPNDKPIEKTFNKPELMIPIKCNQHPWMRMYLNVLGHPFFAVTGPDGKFEIKGLPPGEYTLAAVHEKMGEQELKVAVGPKESKKAEFTFTFSSTSGTKLN